VRTFDYDGATILISITTIPKIDSCFCNQTVAELLRSGSTGSAMILRLGSIFFYDFNR